MFPQSAAAAVRQEVCRLLVCLARLGMDRVSCTTQYSFCFDRSVRAREEGKGRTGGGQRVGKRQREGVGKGREGGREEKARKYGGLSQQKTSVEEK